MMNHNPIDFAASILDQTLEEIARVRDFIQKARESFSHSHIEYKSENNLVSYVDRQAEEMLVYALGALVPGCGFIGEEGSLSNADAAYRWIIDPLDGTTNFVHDIPVYCISAALQYNQETILGVVCDVPRSISYYAVKGRGAFANGSPIRTSDADNLEKTLLCMGFPYPDSGIDLNDYLAVLKSFVSTSRGMRRFGAAALDLVWVACGKLDGYYEWGLQPWDVAAGALIITEAGGHVTDFSGSANFVFGRQVVATNGLIHDQMLDKIRPHYRL